MRSLSSHCPCRRSRSERRPSEDGERKREVAVDTEQRSSHDSPSRGAAAGQSQLLADFGDRLLADFDNRRVEHDVRVAEVISTKASTTTRIDSTRILACAASTRPPFAIARCARRTSDRTRRGLGGALAEAPRSRRRRALSKAGCGSRLARAGRSTSAAGSCVAGCLRGLRGRSRRRTCAKWVKRW